jgi:hypothetical protein
MAQSTSFAQALLAQIKFPHPVNFLGVRGVPPPLWFLISVVIYLHWEKGLWVINGWGGVAE